MSREKCCNASLDFLKGSRFLGKGWKRNYNERNI